MTLPEALAKYDMVTLSEDHIGYIECIDGEYHQKIKVMAPGVVSFYKDVNIKDAITEGWHEYEPAYC